MKKKKTIYKPFDSAAYPDNDVVIVEYLSAAAEGLPSDAFVAALGDAAKARGMAQIAKESGLSRESLYKALSAGAHPRFETVNSVLHALGVKFTVVAQPRRSEVGFVRKG
jgi:probable addiction module antidote protein